MGSETSDSREGRRVEVGTWLRPLSSCPVLQNQEYEHPRDLAACCGSCRNVSCLFTFPNGTTSLFLVGSPVATPLGRRARARGAARAQGEAVSGRGLHLATSPRRAPSVPSSLGRPGSQTAPAITAAALPWAPCSSAHPSAAPRSTRPSVPRSVPASPPPTAWPEASDISRLTGGGAGGSGVLCAEVRRGSLDPCPPSSTSLPVVLL